MKHLSSPAPLLVVVALLAGCDETRPGPEAAMPGGQVQLDTAERPMGVDEQLADSVAAALDPLPADTTAMAVMALVEAEEYRRNWTHWPGREPHYEGTDPHGRLLSTWLDPVAESGLAALRSGATARMPAGAVIVKENFLPDTTLAALTVMYKAERGYDPEHGDWFWLKVRPAADMAPEPGGEVVAAGRVASCIACHDDAAASTDYLMTARADAREDER